MTDYVVNYGEERIAYQLQRVADKKRRITIHILPDGQVHVEAAPELTPQDVKTAVYKRARWLFRNLKLIKAQKQYVLPREYVSGESHYYLGKRYMLKVKTTATDSAGVKLLRGTLQVVTNDSSPETVKKLLDEWYRSHAAEVFSRRLDEIWPDIRWLKQKPVWKLLAMKKQWGSCSPKGVISLNPYLVKAPRDCVDYVIIHELCHLKIHNHSKDYYKLLARALPGWQSVKVRLDKLSEIILVI